MFPEVLTRPDAGPDGNGATPDRPGGPRTADPAGSGDPRDLPRHSAVEIARTLGRAEPTPEQRTIIEAPLRSMLVVAGAGSGKTETMAARVVWLVANGLVAAEEVLGLTFTRKAAGELAARIAARLRALAAAGLSSAAPVLDDGAAVVSTYHAYAGRIVSEHGLRLGVEPDARLLTEAAAWQLAHEVVTSYDGPMDRVGHAESTVTKAVVALSGELAEHLRTIAEVDDFYARFTERVEHLPLGSARAKTTPKQVRELLSVVAARRQLVPIVAAYERVKRDRGCIDFADQVALAARLARDFPEVARQERARYRVVLLDEFQDTSEAQMVLLRSLFADPAAGPPVPVVAVGDPHQSIYGWRGASATTLARFPRQFAAAPSARGPAGAPGAAVQRSPFDEPTGGPVLDAGCGPAQDAGCGPDHGREAPATDVRHLSVSWRNTEGVLGVANRVAAPLTAASPIPVRRLQPAPGAGLGAVEIARLMTVADEADHVARRLAQEWFDASGTRTGATAAVLCRRRAQFVPVIEALRAQNLPVEVVGLGGLLTMPEVQDVVALLSVVADPARGDRLMRLLTGPGYRLGAADLDGLAAWSRELRRHDRSRSAQPTRSAVPGRRPQGEPAAEAVAVDTAAAAGSAETGVLLPPEELPSIIEAVERLPPPGWVGPEGEALSGTARDRLRALAGAIARLRAMTGAPLAEQCAEAERLLRLDVELLARPDLPAEGARVHLDAFADAAASFAAAADRPSLGAFLAWLEVALEEERGLEAPAAAVSADAVQVLTVHAAKGLEWDVVAVPGLVEGAFPSTGAARSTYDERAGGWRLAPARDKGWCVGLERLPYDLRGDADGLPRLGWRHVPDLAALEKELTAVYVAGGERMVAEERRLAYVAFTRARRLALLTAPVWTEATTPRVTSRFLLEVAEHAEHAEHAASVEDTSSVELGEGAQRGEDAERRVPPEVGSVLSVGPWAEMPEPSDGTDPSHPGDGRAASTVWPHDPLADRRALLLAGAETYARQVAALPPDPGAAAALLEAEVIAAAEGGSAHDAELLAVIRERRRAAAPPSTTIELPAHLSTSSLVALYADAQAYAERLRRPMPEPPATRARSGSAFHAWVEQHYQRAAFVDVDDLPGSGDVDHDVLDLADAKARFLASEWALRRPIDVELALETHLAGLAIRGRIDAVFPDVGLRGPNRATGLDAGGDDRTDGSARAGGDDGAAGRSHAEGSGRADTSGRAHESAGADGLASPVVVVDWKTGRPPTGRRARAAAVQLGVYRLAYARLRGLPLAAVRGAFYYVATGETVYPELPDAAQLEEILTRPDSSERPDADVPPGSEP